MADRRDDARGKKIVFVSSCLLNTNNKVKGLARYSGMCREVFDTLCDNGLGIQQEGLSRRGEADGPGAAVKEGAAQSFFQKMDLLGHGGLRDVVLLGVLCNAAGLRRRYEVFQLFPVHKSLQQA